MFTVSDEALKKIKEFMEEQEEPKPIRIAATENRWKIPSLLMALDAVEEEDEVIDKGGVTFVIGKKLFEKVKPVRIEYVHSGLGSGFTVDSAFTDKAKNAEAQCHNIYGSCQEFGD